MQVYFFNIIFKENTYNNHSKRNSKKFKTKMAIVYSNDDLGNYDERETGKIQKKPCNDRYFIFVYFAITFIGVVISSSVLCVIVIAIHKNN